MPRAAMVLIDPADRAALDFDGLRIPGFAHTILREVDFARLGQEADTLVAEAQAQDVDFVIYSRNDQVFDRQPIGPMIRRFRTGYSTLSGIDTPEAHAQARAALADLRRGQGDLAVPRAAQTVRLPARPRGTFSLVFDTEQMACIRVGLPRILPLLDRYGVRATFFVTGFVAHLYPALLPTLAERAHEIGIHGPFHEWMAGLPPDEQRRRLGEHLADFQQYGPVVGANFIFRTDAHTIHALMSLGIRYVTTFALHHYRPFAYRQIGTQPLPIVNPASGQGLWLVPVPVETYSLPWFGTRLLIDSALDKARQETGREHVTVLMHPFRDGSNLHLPHLEALLRYLVEVRQLRPVTLAEHVSGPAPTQADMRIYTTIERIDGSYPEAYARTPWTRSEYYFDRLSNIYRGLKALGQAAALALTADGCTYAVHPEAPEGAQAIPFDPMVAAREGSPGWKRLLDLLDGGPGEGMRTFAPPDQDEQRTVTRILNRPHRLGDLTAFPSEALIRLAYRLRRGRGVF